MPAASPSATAPPADAPVLRLHGISKRFGNLCANDHISLDLARGEVLALLGENGAGKSTLVNILFGHDVADAGFIEVGGLRLPPGQPKAALAAGIGMVHQHFTLAHNLSVLDNVMLGTEPLYSPWSRRRAARAALLAQAAQFGLLLDPEARVGSLSVGERQRVEIMKALFAFGHKQGARILILDEPTAVLTPQESQHLFATLGKMVALGLAIIFISHKLGEVLRVSHRVAVLRGGRLVATVAAVNADQHSLAELMVGKSVVPARRVSAAPAPAASQPSGAPALELVGAHLASSSPGARHVLQDINLRLWPGELLAVAGVAGNGQAALAELLCGQRALSAGTLQVAGRAVPARPAAFVQAGVARVPEDRHQVGAIGDLSLWENAVLERFRLPAFSRCSWLKRRAAKAHAQALLQRFDVRGAEQTGVATRARQLSGGNLQKLILGRVLMATAGAPPPPLIVAQQPTWGLDVGAVACVHQQLLDACAAGSAVLLISEDLDEVFALADRIAVMHQGRLSAALPRAEWTMARIGLAMAGAADIEHSAGPARGSIPTPTARA